MKKLALVAVCLLSAASAQAGGPNLSKACKKVLNHSIYLAHEQQKIALQFDSSENRRSADSILADGVDACVEMALDGKRYSDKKKSEVAERVSAMAEQYIQDRTPSPLHTF